MGGGMAYGDRYAYGLRYPYGNMGLPRYNSVLAPRRPSRLWVDESYPDEGTNLGRKRKLERVKGEPVVANYGKNVLESLFEGPLKGTSPTSRKSEAMREASSDSRPSSWTSPSSPSSPLASANSNLTEKQTVTIPVTFRSKAAANSVPVVLPDGTKKPKRTFNEETAAILIQSAFKGYSLRRSKPLEHMRRILDIRSKLREIERQLSEESTVQKMITNSDVRLRVTEGIMALLLQLDGIQGVHSDVRVWRKAVTKEAVMLQERVDVLLGEGRKLEIEAVPVESSDPSQVEGDSVMASEAVLVESSVARQDEGDSVMVSEGGNVGRDEAGDEDMSDVVPKQFAPETDNWERTLVDDIVLHRLKLEDDEEPLEAREDNILPEAIESVAVEGAADQGIEVVTDSAARATRNTTEIAEDGQRMEVDGESPREQDKGDECGSGSGDFDYSLRSDRLEQEKLKNFLKEISCPSEELTARNPRSLQSVEEAEEAESRGANGTSCDREEDDGAVASSEQRTTKGVDDTEAARELTEKIEIDQLLVKLSEENKMLKSLLLNVMKWNQLQANSMKNLTERLGKVEDRLMKKSGGGKSKIQRCPRYKLERRMRR
ncbi:hypothetical protein R1flu_001730 [Riccia fluitans]|uniref:BAG domain-containing protein n=1 Tax=Riccia fluitans TaxID=41844 RepID=A0ABD1Y439_9MARC